MAVVIICLFISAVASAASGVFLFILVNNVITPALSDGFSSVVPEFIALIVAMAVVYGLGVVCSWIYSRIMASVGQRTLNALRKDMFANMEKLPISYFDKNKHGDIMSYYTNDIDAIRQFISQSMVQIISTVFTLVILTVFMLYFSVWLTIVVYLCAAVMLAVIKIIGGKSAKHFVRQQISTAKVEGFIEETVNGEKVVKVFTHGEATIGRFQKIKRSGRADSEKANTYGNIIMPALGSIGNYMYVLLAIIGGVFCMLTNVQNLALTGFAPMTVAVIVSFLSMSRQFGQSIAQVSQQTSMCAMAFAGAGRVFALLTNNPKRTECHCYSR